MKRQSILLILLLLLTLLSCCGCSAKEFSSAGTTSKDIITPEPAAVTEETIDAIAEESATVKSVTKENVPGIFEGLEDNHTALFSFDGAETAFFFDDPAVQTVLSEAVIGSTYTLSYHYDTESGHYIIYQISE